MTVLHMDTDAVHTVANELSQLLSGLYGELPLLRAAANTLEVGTPDPQIALLMGDLRAILDVCNEVAAAGDDLSLRLSKAAAHWQTADQEGVTQFNGACATLTMTTEANLVAVAPPAASASNVAAPDTAVAPPPVEPTKPDDLTEAAAADQSDTAQSDANGQPVAPAPEATDVTETAVVEPPPAVPPDRSWNHRLAKLDQVNQEIKTFEARPVSSFSEEEARHLNELYDQRLQLRDMIDEGIGPSTPATNNFAEGECTWYVASRRHVGALSGHAHTWVDSALNNGYEVGDIPVKGSVMVWQPGVHGAHESYGHVAHVEQVIANNDGSYTVRFTDNHNGNAEAPSEVRIKPGDEGVDFIYERPFS